MKFWLPFLLLVVFSGCKKDPLTYNFSGTITNSQSSAAINGVDVLIEQQIFNSTATNFNHVYAGDDMTNSNGEYAIEFERDKATEFKFTLTKSGYFDVQEIQTSNGVSVEDVNIRDFTLEPISYVRFEITNSLPDPGDVLKFYTYNFKEGCSGCTTNGFKYFPGEVDTSITYTTTASEYVRFFFTDEATGATTEDSLLTIHKDTVVYTFNY